MAHFGCAVWGMGVGAPERDWKVMAKKLFVGNLSWNTRNEGLYEAFSRFGEVSEATVITDRDTGRSRGFGFVTFEDEAAGEDAMAAMDGQTLDGRPIRVNEAQQRRRDGGGGGGRRNDRW